MTSLTNDAYVGTLTADVVNYTTLNPTGGSVAPITNPMTSDLDCDGAGGPYSITNADNITCNNIDFTTSVPPIPTGFVANPMTEELKGGGQNFTNVNDIGCASLTATGLVSGVGITSTAGATATTLSVSGDTTIGGALTMTGGFTANGGIVVNGNETINGPSTTTGTLGCAGLTCAGLTATAGPNTLNGSTTINGQMNANGGIAVVGNYAGGGSIGATGNATINGNLLCGRLIMGSTNLGSFATPVDLSGATPTINITNKSKGSITCYNASAVYPVIKVETGITNASKSGSLIVSVSQLSSTGLPQTLTQTRIEDGTPQTELNVYITMASGTTAGNPIRVNVMYIAD
tara:strand:+ start:626 stop:1666 length:1041 start_codon:yes stop_codon:yes gene_type:complete